ncbi:uncharacterized protein LOC122004315 [Zingiber officinale]|uniref:uncharacterized protein LOC122004315 n=1 Tax=Zingiber officinale TaxID=94328 RepID=UPI001C4ACA90|nr:uncharacterized protein LOC122004315 [Zingiber officinale]
MIKQIPKYAKFFKDLCVHKKKLKENEISMGKNVSALIQLVPQKCEDPGVFIVPWIGPLQPTRVIIQLADHSQTHPAGVIEDVLVKVRELIFPANFYILDIEGDYLANRSPLILGRSFLKTTRTKIDVHAGTLSIKIEDTVVQFSIFDAMKHPREDHSILSLDILEELDGMDFFSEIESDLDFIDVGQGDVFSACLEEDVLDMGVDTSSCGLSPIENDDLCTGDCLGEALPLGSPRGEEVCVGNCSSAALPLGSLSIDQTQDELKSLPQHLKYAYLGENQKLPVIIAQNLEPE